MPAVTRPPARNAGFSCASPSSDVSGRRNSSRSATFQPSSVKTAIGTTVSLITPFVPRCRRALLRLERERVGALLRDRGEAVVQVLGRLAHRRGGLVDQPLGDEARVEVDVLAHRVMAHVLDAAGERDVDRAERDLACGRGDGGERAGAHPVDREARDGVRGCPASSATSRPSVRPWSPTCAVAARTTSPIRSGGISGLRRSSSRTALTPMSSARVRQYWPFGPGLAERRPHAVDEEDLARLAHARTIAS